MYDEKRNTRAKVIFIIGVILMFIAIISIFNTSKDDSTRNAINLILDAISLGLIFGSFIYNHGSIKIGGKLFARKNSNITLSSGDTPHCPTCKSTDVEKISEVNKKNNSNLGKNILIIVLGVILLIIVCVSFDSCSRQQEQLENQKFKDQMKQDPSTWNKEQKNRYNDFVEWEDKQQENK